MSRSTRWSFKFVRKPCHLSFMQLMHKHDEHACLPMHSTSEEEQEKATGGTVHLKKLWDMLNPACLGVVQRRCPKAGLPSKMCNWRRNNIHWLWSTGQGTCCVNMSLLLKVTCLSTLLSFVKGHLDCWGTTCQVSVVLFLHLSRLRTFTETENKPFYL